MKQRTIDLFFSCWAFLIFILGMVFHSCKLHLWGKGVEYEAELTWGLTACLDLVPATFYELNFLYLCFFWSLTTFLMVQLRKFNSRKTAFSENVHLANLITLMIPFWSGMWHFQRIESLPSQKEKYVERYFEHLDDALVTTQRIVVEFDASVYQISYCAFLLFLTTAFLLIWNTIYLARKSEQDSDEA
ncbi:MAG: hypothetical protein AAF985_16870 [Bacteroidota bacterium]